MKTTADRIKEGMELRQLKQSDLVEKTGISKGALSSYISGRYVPKQNNIYLISKALDVNESWLMGNDVPMERQPQNSSQQCALNANENVLVKEYRKLNNVGKKKLIATAREMNCNPLYNANYQSELAANAAHTRTDIDVTAEMMQNDDDIMDSEDF